jgi:hypothetical protein
LNLKTILVTAGRAVNISLSWLLTCSQVAQIADGLLEKSEVTAQNLDLCPRRTFIADAMEKEVV